MTDPKPWVEKLTKIEIEFVCEETRNGSRNIHQAIHEFRRLILVNYLGFELIEGAKEKVLKLKEVKDE